MSLAVLLVGFCLVFVLLNLLLHRLNFSLFHNKYLNLPLKLILHSLVSKLLPHFYFHNFLFRGTSTIGLLLKFFFQLCNLLNTRVSLFLYFLNFSRLFSYILLQILQHYDYLVIFLGKVLLCVIRLLSSEYLKLLQILRDPLCLRRL